MKLGWEDHFGHETPENSQTPQHEDTVRIANAIYEKAALIRNRMWWRLGHLFPSLQNHEEEISVFISHTALL